MPAFVPVSSRHGPKKKEQKQRRERSLIFSLLLPGLVYGILPLLLSAASTLTKSSKEKRRLSDFDFFLRALFSDAESGKNACEHVLGSSLTSDLAKVTKSVVKTNEDDLFTEFLIQAV